MLYSEEFLKRLDEHREKTIYAKIISLDLEENPIEQVEGTVTSGSVNVDGASSVRRTCSLSMVIKDIKINEYYWGLNTKFKLEIGVENKIDANYPKIIWFKMGTYIITSFNVSYTTNSANISLQGKDKMCLLNGDVGGVINATTDFGTYDFYDVETGVTTNYKLPIKQILWDAVHTYANEPFHNIILNDLDELGLELLDYKYDEPLYLLRAAGTDVYAFPIIGDMDVWVPAGDNTTIKKKLSEIQYDHLTTSMIGNIEPPTEFYIASSGDNQLYQAAKIEYGQTAGYRTCDLVYAGDLIANIGDSVTSVFDKIKNMLGQFEYFYDLDGRFVFQRQKSLVNTVWTPQKRDGDNELYVEALALASNNMYNFKGNILLSSIQNNPNLLNLRNDYTVWGKRKTLSGGEVPIHMRYAIDNKPYRYVDMNGNVWTTLSEAEVEAENENKKRRSIRAEIEERMANFEKNPNLYPAAWQEIVQENPWWHVQEWAEYYAILSGGIPPGNTHPYHEMRYIAKNVANNMTQFTRYWPGVLLRSSSWTVVDRDIANFKNGGNYPLPYTSAQAVAIYRCKDPNDGFEFVAYDSHAGCVHTYGEWLSTAQYVNGCVVNGHTYDPFDPNYPWHLLPSPGSYVDGMHSKTFLDQMRTKYGLYRVDVYCYDPEIPEKLKEDFISQLEQQYEYVDPYEGHYKYEMDWREIIYRMAIDYRRYNHDDDFEVRLAANNTPLYPRGVTGYEQYYTDLEGFWRQLYYPVFDDEDRKKQLEYEFTLYRDIRDLTDMDNLYVRGVYKPIGQRVKSIASENEETGKTYYKDTVTGKSYYHNDNTQYYLSNTDGFTFVTSGWPKLGSAISETDFKRYVDAGQLYTRNMPSINDLYRVSGLPDGCMYPYLDLFNYRSSDAVVSTDEQAETLDTITHYLKRVNASDPQNPIYEPIGIDKRSLSLEEKKGSYTIVGRDAEVQIAAQNEYNRCANFYDALCELMKLSSVFNANTTINDVPTEVNKVSKLKNQPYFSLWRDCECEKMLNANITIQLQQSRLKTAAAKAKEKLSAASAALERAKADIHYQLFSEYVLQNSNYHTNNDQNTTLPTLDNVFVYAENELCCLKDIIANSTLKSLYVNDLPFGKHEAKRYLYYFALDICGNRLPDERRTSITYYTAYTDFYDEDHKHKYWHKDVYEAPQVLNFWFDFLTGDDELRQFTTQAIGDRPKAVNENTIKSIYYRDTPKIIFTSVDKFASEEHKSGYNYFIMKDGYDNMFSISSQGIDCKNRIDELIYQYSYCTESVTLQSIPIYYLDVNKRIHVYDDESGIDGDYVVSKISFPLQYNGMMSITATKAPENSVTEREE